jgi:hypothetical protein
MDIHLQRIICIQVSVQQFVAQVTAFLGHGELVKNHTELMCDVLQSVSSNLMRNHQVGLYVGQLHRFLANQTVCGQHGQKLCVIPKLVEVPCHHGHGNSLEGRTRKQIPQQANQFLRVYGQGSTTCQP